MTVKFPHLRAAVMRHPWAITEESLDAIVEVLERRLEGTRLSRDEIAAIKGERKPNGVLTYCAADLDGNPVEVHETNAEILARGAAGRAQGTESPVENGSVIGVIRIAGIISQHANVVDDISGPGGTSTERVLGTFRQALADPAVKGIVLRIDSPGGNVHGVQVLADEIFKARGRKPIIAQVDSLAASAAYWIASAADEVVVTPGGQVGSIGVYAMHKDVSVAAEKQGVKVEYIAAGKHKVEGHQFEPLQDEARAAMQKTVDAYYRDFVRAVARGRGVSVDDVRNGFGEGRVEKDTDAVKLGMADRVAPLDDTLRRLGGAKRPAGAHAEAAATVQAEAEPILIVNTEFERAGSLRTADLAIDAAARSAAEAASEAEIARQIQAKAEQDAAERDAFRRRRHALRLRKMRA